MKEICLNFRTKLEETSRTNARLQKHALISNARVLLSNINNRT